MNPYKKALLLSYATVGYNVLEGIVALVAGGLARSPALIAFGFDSFIESFSGSVMIWRFYRYKDMTEEEEKKIELKASHLVGWSFFVLGAYVAYESVKKLFLHEVPDPSLLGIIVALLSTILMPLLYWIKYKTGEAIHSHSLMADSKQTLLCSLMSVALLLGLGLNYFFGLWWADQVTGLILVGLMFKEGFVTLRAKHLCC